MLSGVRYEDVIANSVILNLREALMTGGRRDNRGFFGINLYAYWHRFFAILAYYKFIPQDPPLRLSPDFPDATTPAIAWRFDAASLPPALKGINPQKTIVLNPCAQSMKCDISVFELIAERAAQMGYTALCHVHRGQKGLKACGSVECTLKEIGTFLARGAALIALRSGFVDVMLHTGCKIVSILPREIPIGHFDSEETMRINPNVADVVIREGDYCATVDEVFQKLDELAQKERARCSTT